MNRALPEHRVSLRLALLLGLWISIFTGVPAERLPIKTYTYADGLGHDNSGIGRIFRDSQGFLWFCGGLSLSRFDGYRFTAYGAKNGLNLITDIIEDRPGWYWVATTGGVARFNPSLSQEPAVTKNGADATAPLIGREFHPQIKVYQISPERAKNSANVLYRDRSGVLWVGANGGLFRLAETGGEVRFQPAETGRLDDIFALAEDQMGSLWIGTPGGLVRRSPDGRIFHYAIKPIDGHDRVWSLLTDRDGNLWVGHDAGLFRLKPAPPSRLRIAEFGLRIDGPGRNHSRFFNRQSEFRNPQSAIGDAGEVRWYTTADGLAHNVVKAVLQAADGRIWIGADGGLSEFDHGRFRSYTTAQGLSNNSIRALAEDRAGNLWLATYDSGVMRLARDAFTTYSEADGLGGIQIRQIFANRQSELYVISSNRLISLFDRQSFTTARPKRFAPPRNSGNSGHDGEVIALQDHHGEWWVPTREGLHRFAQVNRLEQLAQARPKAVYTTKDGWVGSKVRQLFEDSRGDLWIGARLPGRGVLTRWERATGTFHQALEFDLESQPSFDVPMVFGEDQAGSLWVGFWHDVQSPYGYGDFKVKGLHGVLARYSAGRFKLFTLTDGVPGSPITALHCDQAGRLWFGTSRHGVGRIDNPASERLSFIAYTSAEGLVSDDVTAITEDLFGRIYVGTTRGLDRLDLTTGQIKHYTTADGLASEAITAALRDSTGALWFGTDQGLSRLTPEPSRPASPLPILINGLRIAGAPYALSEFGQTEVSGLEIGPEQNNLSIDFSSLNFDDDEEARYQYRLEGADRDWGPLTDQRLVNYAQLSAGTYRFSVRAVNRDDVAGRPAVVAFTILRPSWQRWWFVLLAATAVGLSLYLIHRYRVQRLLELERVRLRIATDLHDDIGSSLSRIAILSEVVRQRLGETNRQVDEPLSTIASSSRELVDSMSDIVWSINPKRDHLQDLTQRMRRFASDVFTARNVKFRFHTPEALPDVRLDIELRRQVFLIFKESVNNMLRHSGCTEAEIEFRLDGHQLVLVLTDNGKGIDSVRAGNGHGLASMAERAEKLGGELTVTSNHGQGTSVRLQVPLDLRPLSRWQRLPT